MNKQSKKALVRYLHLLSELRNLEMSIPGNLAWTLTRNELDAATVHIELSPKDPSVLGLLYDLLVTKEGDPDYFDSRIIYTERAIAQFAMLYDIASNPPAEGKCNDCGEIIQSREWRYHGRGGETVCYDCHLKQLEVELASVYRWDDDSDEGDDDR